MQHMCDTLEQHMCALHAGRAVSVREYSARKRIKKGKITSKRPVNQADSSLNMQFGTGFAIN